MPDPADLGLTAAAAALADGELSAAELVDACLRRATATAELGAFTELCGERAHAEAAARDRERPVTALHGVPVGVKDLVDVAGMPTRAGSSATGDEAAAADAPIVARLRAAGAVVMGKTATHEFAYGVTTRATRNPWSDERLAGGSSGGSAVAVAVGACPVALGSDTAGSCRIPAALCGVAGMMARPGTLDMAGVVALAPGLDALGLLARGAEDLALAWSALTGTPATAPAALRVGTARADRLGDVDPDALAAADHVAAMLAAGGGSRATLDLPVLDDFSRPRGTLIAALALEGHRVRGWWPQRAERYGDDIAAQMRAAEGIADTVVAAARERLGELGRRLRAALATVDVLVLPTTPGAAPLRDGDDPLERRERRHTAELTRLCGPVNAAGLAAVSVFGGLDAAGLPLGVQILARDEATALGAAAACERLAGPPPRPPLRTVAGAGAVAGRHPSAEEL